MAGGNLTLVENSLGTPCTFRGNIKTVFLEDAHVKPYSLERSLDHMKLAGVFDGTTAVVFGSFAVDEQRTGNCNVVPLSADQLIALVFQRFTVAVPFPVFQVDGIGHSYINDSLPLNTEAALVGPTRFDDATGTSSCTLTVDNAYKTDLRNCDRPPESAWPATYSLQMDMLYARPMPVADHFMASCTNEDGQTAAEVYLGEVCETCYAHFAAGKTELWRHARDEHSADPSLSCHVPGCGRRFFAAAMCTDHRAHHHRSDGHHDIAGPNDLQPPLTCELCGRLSSNPSKYDRHMSTAHPEALTAICGVCHSYEGDVSSLIDHVQRRHALEICAEVTTETTDSESDPKRPSRRIIRCTVCGKRCGNNRHMYNHRKVHCLADDVDNGI